MLEKIISENKEEMISALSELLSVPSVSEKGADGCEYGKNVADALDICAGEAKKLGFDAINRGYLCDIPFGSGEKKVYIAAHADVVPAGDGWTVEPYKLTRKDGRLYGRGAIDDKGPAMAVLYAMSAVKKAGYTPKVDLHLLIGGAEETGMDDLPRYMKEYGFPDEALTPDSGFPIINTEAGMYNARIVFTPQPCEGKVYIKSFVGGSVSNAVPDNAKAVIGGEKSILEATENALNSLKINGLDAKLIDGELIVTASGKSAHASIPQCGDNAILKLADALWQIGCKNKVIDILNKYFTGCYNAEKIGLEAYGEILGKTTLNIGVIDYENGYFTVDMRLTAPGLTEKVRSRYEEVVSEYGFEACVYKCCEYTHIDEESEFMQKLGKSFEEYFNKPVEYLGACGLTYAKALGGKGVAFGSTFEDDGDECGGLHGKDEYISEDAIMTLCGIYAKVIVDLWC